MTDLQELWRINHAWRQWMDANTKFVTPETIDTLRYCRIEANEAADVEMRVRLTKHARNNARTLTVHEELADCAMLALTALPEPEKWEKHDFNFSPLSPMDEICSLSTMVVNACLLRSEYWPCWLIDLLAAIDAYPGMNLRTELVKCHGRLGWKHGGDKWVMRESI